LEFSGTDRSLTNDELLEHFYRIEDKEENTGFPVTVEQLYTPKSPNKEEEPVVEEAKKQRRISPITRDAEGDHPGTSVKAVSRSEVDDAASSAKSDESDEEGSA
jgi:hypothetical protein